MHSQTRSKEGEKLVQGKFVWKKIVSFNWLETPFWVRKKIFTPNKLSQFKYWPNKAAPVNTKTYLYRRNSNLYWSRVKVQYSNLFVPHYRMRYMLHMLKDDISTRSNCCWDLWWTFKYIMQGSCYFNLREYISLAMVCDTSKTTISKWWSKILWKCCKK